MKGQRENISVLQNSSGGGVIVDEPSNSKPKVSIELQPGFPILMPDGSKDSTPTQSRYGGQKSKMVATQKALKKSLREREVQMK